MKTLIAFANTAGGTMVIGRDDSGKITGIEDVLQAEERIANAIADSIMPAMMPDVEIITYGSKDLLILRVAHWSGPFYLKNEGPLNVPVNDRQKWYLNQLDEGIRISSTDLAAQWNISQKISQKRYYRSEAQGVD
jgi:predicted HTH transcriptional regulator